MADDVAKRRGDALYEEAIAKAHAIYTPSMLSIYDLFTDFSSEKVNYPGVPTPVPIAAR